MKKNSLITLLSLLICTAQAQRGEITAPQKIRITPTLIYKKFRSQGSLIFPIKAEHQTLRIRTGSGNVEILPNEQSADLEIEAELLMTSLSRKKAQKFLERFTRLSIQEKGSKLQFRGEFNLNTKKRRLEGDRYVEAFSLGGFLGTPGSRIHLKIKVPPQLHLEIYNASGNLKVQGISNPMYIRDNAGSIHLENIQGALKLKDHSGRIIIKNLQGSLELSDKSGYVKLENIQGDVDLKDASGNLYIKELDGNLTLKDKSGHIYIESVSQTLDIRDASGKIVVDHVAYQEDQKHQVQIRDRSGHIYLKNIQGELLLKDRSGKIYQ